MTHDIVTFAKACIVCQQGKTCRDKPYGELGCLGPAIELFEIVSIDTVCGLHGYGSSKRYIHVAIDNFTRFFWALSSTNQTAVDFVNLIKTVLSNDRIKSLLADRYRATSEATMS
jgi:hypothetical protein